MVDWTNVLIALVGVIPASIAAVGVILINKRIKTPSGTAIGKQIEGVLHTALANNYHLRAIGGAVNAASSPEAHTEAQQVPDLPESNGDPPPPTREA